jgi:hypothetical protein
MESIITAKRSAKFEMDEWLVDDLEIWNCMGNDKVMILD